MEGKEGFARKFEDFHELISRNPILTHAWDEYNETLIKNPELMPLSVRNTRPASNYFSRNNVIGDRLNLRFYSAMHNLLTGTGILGTFVGLVAGIWLASSGLAAAEIATVKDALQQLLNGASLAFMSSIAGLVSSMLFSWKEKYWVHRLDSSLRNWNAELESRLLLVTDESLNAEQLAGQRQQTEILTEFTNQLAFQIAEEFQEQMGRSVGPVMERLVSAVEGMREDQRCLNDDLLKQMVDKLSDSLNGAAGDELSALGETIHSLNEQLSGQFDSLVERQREMDESATKARVDFVNVVKWSTEEMHSSIGEALESVVDKIGGMVDGLAGELKTAARETAASLLEAGQKFHGVIDKLNEALEGTSGTAEKYEELLSDTADAISQINMASEAISKVIGPMEKSTAGLCLSADTFKDAGGEMKASVEGIGQVVGDLKSMQEGIQSSWRDYASRFEAVDEDLGKVFSTLSVGLEQYADQVRAFVEQLDKHTGSIVSDLAGANAELTSAVEDLVDALQRKS